MVTPPHNAGPEGAGEPDSGQPNAGQPNPGPAKSGQRNTGAENARLEQIKRSWQQKRQITDRLADVQSKIHRFAPLYLILVAPVIDVCACIYLNNSSQNVAAICGVGTDLRAPAPSFDRLRPCVTYQNFRVGNLVDGGVLRFILQDDI